MHTAPVVAERKLPNGGAIRNFNDGSKQIVAKTGAVIDRAPNGHTTYTNPQGRVTQEVFGATRATYHDDGSRTVVMGHRQFNERLEDHDNRQVLIRDYKFRSSVVNRDFEFRRQYHSDECHEWREPMWFYATDLALGTLNYEFFGPRWNNPYRQTWGWDDWNSRQWNGYGWYQYYSTSYWKPWGYRHHDYYRPSYAIVDYVLAETYELAWEARLEAAREAAREEYEERIAAAENDAETAALQAQADAAAAQAAAAEAQAAQAEAQAAANAASGATAVSDEDQAQLANQVEQVSNDRTNQTPVNTAFETALGNDAFLFLVSSQPEGTFDNGEGACILHIGDVLQKDSMVEGSGLVSMKVKVAQPSSCRAGTIVTMTVPQLQSIYDAFQEQMDTGAQQLADGNQPQN